MQSSASALDEAFERMAHSDFELPNGFVNHGPMACEALCVLGLDDRIDGWSRRFVRLAGDGPRPEAPWAFAGTGWHDALGGYRRLPEWIGHFDQVIADDGWRNTVRVWVPRLVPGVGAALFHGVIRTAQAVRAVSRADSSARQAELARSMAYWAARFTAGPPPVNGSGGDAGMELLGAAAVGARCFVDQPTIVNLHGVTGALAVDLLLDHLDTGAAEAAVAQILAEHQSLYPAVIHPATDRSERWQSALVPSAADSGDAHQVKLVEACRRGFEQGGDPAFVAAARTVTGDVGRGG